jgi:hypothetical protein
LPAPTPAERGPSRWQLERRLEALEAQIASVEEGLEELGDQLAAPDGLQPGDVQRIMGQPPEPPSGPPPTQAEILALLGARHATLESELLELMEEWHDITDRLAAA